MKSKSLIHRLTPTFLFLFIFASLSTGFLFINCPTYAQGTAPHEEGVETQKWVPVSFYSGHASATVWGSVFDGHDPLCMDSYFDGDATDSPPWIAEISREAACPHSYAASRVRVAPGRIRGFGTGSGEDWGVAAEGLWYGEFTSKSEQVLVTWSVLGSSDVHVVGDGFESTLTHGEEVPQLSYGYGGIYYGGIYFFVGSEHVDFTAFSFDGTLEVLEAVESCAVSITEPVNVIRGSPSKINATLSPSTFRPHHIEWVFRGGKGGKKVSGTKLYTTVKMVDADNLYYVDVNVYSDATTLACTDTALIKVKPRTGTAWELKPTIKPDNEPGWGSLIGILPVYPCIYTTGTTGQNINFGEYRDRVSNLGAFIIPNPLIPNQRWEDGYKVAQVRDPGGPNDGYWYIKSSSFKIDRETVINKWLKSKGPSPARGFLNWYNVNHNKRCLKPNPDTFIQAVKNHENSGSGKGSTGHHGLMRDAEAQEDNDARTKIEDNFSAITKGELINATADEVYFIETILGWAIHEDNVHGNWAGGVLISFWVPSEKEYCDCFCNFRPF